METFLPECVIDSTFTALTSDIVLEEQRARRQAAFQVSPRPVPADIISTGLPAGHAAFTEFTPVSSSTR